MGISRTRLGVVMAMAFWCFGCKGAGQAFRVVGVVAAVAVRVAAEAAVAAAAHGGGGEGGEEPSPAPPPPPPPASPESVAMVSAHPRCAELGVAPELPGDTVAVRTVSCGGRVMVQDSETGRWREHR